MSSGNTESSDKDLKDLKDTSNSDGCGMTSVSVASKTNNDKSEKYKLASNDVTERDVDDDVDVLDIAVDEDDFFEQKDFVTVDNYKADEDEDKDWLPKRSREPETEKTPSKPGRRYTFG